ncbi:HNH endonuclease [Georgenia sp. H159]|uniref:HNH endonuclease n=1 Tax=Georgenia sp. H159 TaxID=3076115 RepID=UPI002D77BB40|nr:DUF222 domain-containing protein [Georgenia sp. H159]
MVDNGSAPLPVGVTDVAEMRRLLECLDPAVTVDTASRAGRRAAPLADPARGGHGLTQAQCIDLLRELEDLKAAAAGAQAVVTAHLAQARHDAEQAAGVPADARCKGLASEVALARRLSPHRGGQHLGMARTLREDMPHTLAALRTGLLSEWRATLLVRESICLGTAERRAFDGEMCTDLDRLDGWGDRRLVAEAKKVAYRLDPHSVVERAARAEKDRCVSIRPAPDTMAYLTALLPVSRAVAAHAALLAAATAAQASGDGRSRGQVMADTLVSRLTGTDADVPASVEVQLVMTDHSLLAGGEEPAQLAGHGTVPAAWARDLVDRALRCEAGVWLRRLFTDPADQLVAMESRRRTAPAGLARFIAVRDGGTCRTRWCDAPIRHIDHVVDHSVGGATTAAGLQGCCERCNYVKTAPGWRARPVLAEGPAPEGPRAGPVVETRTPTGHVYRSRPPGLPRVPRAAPPPRRE